MSPPDSLQPCRFVQGATHDFTWSIAAQSSKLLYDVRIRSACNKRSAPPAVAHAWTNSSARHRIARASPRTAPASDGMRALPRRFARRFVAARFLRFGAFVCASSGSASNGRYHRSASSLVSIGACGVSLPRLVVLCVMGSPDLGVVRGGRYCRMALSTNFRAALVYRVRRGGA